MATLDSVTAQLPKDGPLVIVTASFEGLPADNAAQFVDWLESHESPDLLKGIKYVVFGCGNSDWVQTYQRVPKLIDSLFSKCGATRLVDAGAGDVKSGSFFQVFDEFEARMWKALTTVTIL
jgi:cytochrome P450 / NADPH-cytochrome P450 reductase